MEGYSVAFTKLDAWVVRALLLASSRVSELSIDKCFLSFAVVTRTRVTCSAPPVDFMCVQVSSHVESSVVVALVVRLPSVCSHLASHLSDVSIGACCASIVGVDGCCFLFSVLVLACISCV